MNKTKVIKNATIILLSTALIIGMFFFVVVPKVAASTGCFPDTTGHWAEEFICWLYDNGITGGYPDGTYRPENAVTRAEMAVFLQKANELFVDEQILITPGFGEWMPFSSSDNLSWNYYSGRTYVYKSTTGSNFLSLHPSIPTVLYGKKLKVLGVEFCYDANTNAYLDYIEINTYTHTTGPGTRSVIYADNNNRTDENCRFYQLSVPRNLHEDMGLNFFIRVIWDTAGAGFELGRTTFVLQTTDTAAPALLSGQTEVLGGASGSSETNP